jgi:hypothetical protein
MRPVKPSTRWPHSSALVTREGPRSSVSQQSGKAGRYNFPRPLLKELDREGPDRYAFSFSGLKTAVLRAGAGQPGSRGRARGHGARIPGRDGRSAGIEDGRCRRSTWVTLG